MAPDGPIQFLAQAVRNGLICPLRGVPVMITFGNVRMFM